MARSSRHFYKTFNDTLERLQLGQSFANPTDMANQLGVSRTTSRKVLKLLSDKGLTAEESEKTDDAERVEITLARPVDDADFFPKEDTMSTEALIQQKLMHWVIDKNIWDGRPFSEAQFVREFELSHSSIREFLIRLSSYGFVRKEPNRQWVFQGMTVDYVDEIYEFRKFFEQRTLRRIHALEDDHPFWGNLDRLRLKHEQVLETGIKESSQIKELETEFHGCLSRTAGNRFFWGNDDAISLLFYCHYHLTLESDLVAERNTRAVRDHIRIIDALKARDLTLASQEMERHLDSAKSDLINRL
ncbi:FCD domain-containing protein [Epibacterium sp. SM1969]|uniref:FCD domain-containing protein n=1 Tax=Tritonibacter aquimaris TaxID=2663379 RepID=A0A844AXD3_9RHOB|nr:GntR family transcriptional regulator [Tritonibacter aquimaris]MQY44238.1 FCD domain-containing protein [Tritonibacter aquimaris]